MRSLEWKKSHTYKQVGPLSLEKQYIEKDYPWGAEMVQSAKHRTLDFM